MFAKTRAIFAVSMCSFALQFAVPAHAEGNVTYKVKAGDTLYQLADLYFTNQRAREQVVRINSIREPRRLQVGRTLQIPRSLLKYENVAIRVSSFSGPVEVRKQRPTLGYTLAEGDRVETGANGFISFKGNRSTVVSLPSNTKARLVKARRYLLGSSLDIDFEILEGRGEVIAPKLEKQERFRVRTPVAVTAVRGTVFRVAHNVDSSKSVAEVAEGSVGVAAGGQSLLAEGGFGVPLTSDGVGPLERLLPDVKIIDPGAVQTAENVSFSVEPLKGAAQYRTQIANDAGFFEIVGEQMDTRREATFSDLPNGTYFVRSRGVSETGVEGLSEAYSFRRKRLGVTPSAERSMLEDGFKFSWLPEGDGNVTFAFQLWNSEAAGAPIVDEVGIEGKGFIVTGLDAGIYFWRVAAVEADKKGLLKVWSPEQKLNITD